MTDVAGRVVLITGGVEGIGLGIAQAFAEAGARVVVTYRREQPMRAAMDLFAQQKDWSVQPIHMDVTDRASVAAARDEVIRRFGRLHILCNNAGVNLMGPMDQATFEDWDWLLGVNLNGVVNTLVTFLPHMKAHGQGGHVVNVASMSAFITGPNTGLYATSKYAVRGLSESLRYNLAPHGIAVSLVCPGLTRSKIYEAPRNRPEHLSTTGLPVSDESLQKMASVHECGMDAVEVGRRTLAGVQRNDFYVFTHPEFSAEVSERAARVAACFPVEEPDRRRMGFETIRREAVARAEEQIAALTSRPGVEFKRQTGL